MISNRFSNFANVNNRSELKKARAARKEAEAQAKKDAARQTTAESVKETVDVAIEAFKAANGSANDEAGTEQNKVVLDNMVVKGKQRSLATKVAATLSLGLSNLITGRSEPERTLDGVLRTGADKSPVFFDSLVTDTRTSRLGPVAFVDLMGGPKSMKMTTEEDGSKIYEVTQRDGVFDHRQVVKETGQGTLTLVDDNLYWPAGGR